MCNLYTGCPRGFARGVSNTRAKDIDMFKDMFFAEFI